MRAGRRRAATAAAAAAAIVATLALAGPVAAAPKQGPPHKTPARGGGPASAGDQHKAKDPNAPAPAPGGQLTDPTEVASGAGAKQLGALGQVDPLSGLGIANPVCDDVGEIRDRETRLSCEANGTPESSYPASNYGFDVFIDSGIDAPDGFFTKGFVMILNGLWLGLIFVLKLVLALLGLAFGLNPFAQGQTMRQISAAVGQLYTQITQPWLSTAVVCGGIWFAYKGLIRREVAAGVAGTLAALAMLVIGLWVVAQPQASVGRVAALSDRLALGVIGAPQAGSVSRPAGTYAEAMSSVWARLVEVPFAGLDFSDVSWALGRPPPEAVEKADEKFCEDVGALALLATLSNLGDDAAKRACGEFARKRYGQPKRVIDLYLRSSPGSPARQALWDFFDNNDTYKPKVAAQGGDGILTRLSMLALFAIGLLGAVLLLAWLAIRLFSQAAIAFVLLLAAPFALFFPLLGDSGRRAFRTWGLTLLGALFAKVIYAVLLSVVLLGIAIFGQVEGPGGSATGFLLACAFTWAVFLKRAQLVGWMNVGEAEKVAGRGVVAQLAALGVARGALRRGAALPGSAVRTITSRSGAWQHESSGWQGGVTRRNVADARSRSSLQLAEQCHREALRTVDAYEKRGADMIPRDLVSPEPAEGDLTAMPKEGEDPIARRPPTKAERSRYERAQSLLSRCKLDYRYQDQKWTGEHLAQFHREDNELLRSSTDPADHAHRIGLDRTEFEGQSGPERKRSIKAIEKARVRDLQRLEVVEPPGRVRGRLLVAAEGKRQRKEESIAERMRRLRGLQPGDAIVRERTYVSRRGRP